MFTVGVTPEQLEYAGKCELIAKRSEHSFSKVSPYTLYRTGFIGEIVFADLFNLKRPFYDGPDKGSDNTLLKKRVDIKTMGRSSFPKPHYINNFLAHQAKNDSDYIVFASLHWKKMLLTFCGMLPKGEVLMKGKFLPAGSVRITDDGRKTLIEYDLFEIRNDQLEPLNNPGDVRRTLMGGLHIGPPASH